MRKRMRVITSLGILLGVIVCSVLIGKNENSISVYSDMKQPIYRVSKEEKEISITFDVNWAEEEHIYEILEILKSNDIKATFFIMGGWVNYSEENREKLIKIYEEGHEIGNHSYIHPIFTNIAEDRMKEEIEKTENVFLEVVGEKSKLFRFPSGAYDDKSIGIVESMGYKCIQWDVDSVDWKGESAEKEYKRVMDKVQNGSILLFHNNSKYTQENLKRIIPELKEEGYRFKAVGELILDENYSINESGEQYEK